MAGSQAVGARIAASDDDDSFACSQDLYFGIDRIAEAALVLLRQILHRKMNSPELTPRNLEIARMLGSPRQNDGVKITAQIVHGNILANFRTRYKLHAFRRYLVEPAINDVLLQLELRNSVAQQSANAVRFFIHHNRMPGAA